MNMNVMEITTISTTNIVLCEEDGEKVKMQFFVTREVEQSSPMTAPNKCGENIYNR